MSFKVRTFLFGSVFFAAMNAPPARGEVTHTVARGHTIEAIAHRYHVSEKAILEANHLRDGRHLKVGETLVIPGASADDKSSDTGKKGHSKGKTYAMHPRVPGLVHALRLFNNEKLAVRIGRKKRLSTTVLSAVGKLFRASNDDEHPIDPRLIAILAIVSDHFGSRELDIISGFRPYHPTQYTKHSNHNDGKAVDLRVAGVPNEVLRDYCLTLRNVGCGYYPNSTFIHIDVRDSPAFWIDYSHPGEPPRYNSPNANADEATSDVGEAHLTTASNADPAPSSLPPLETAPVSNVTPNSPNENHGTGFSPSSR